MGSGCSTELDASSPGAGNGDVAVSAKIHVQSGAFPTAKAIKPLQKEGDFNYASGYTECIRGDGVKGIVLSKDFMKRADELNAQITKLTAGSNSYLAQFGESFVAVHDTLKTIAHLAVPPPGGQVVAAVVQITAMIIKGQINTRECCALGTQVNKMLRVALEPSNQGAMTTASAGTRETLNDFLVVCGTIQDFVCDVIEQGWFMKMVYWRKTETELTEMTKDLEQVARNLNMAVGMSVLSIVEEARQEQLQVQKLIDDAGGPKKLLTDNDEAKIKALIEKCKGVESVQLAMQREGNDMLRSLVAAMASKATDNDDGPYKIIGHDIIKKMWKDNFGKRESVTWLNFFAFFPKKVPYLDVEEIEVLSAELAGDGESQFKLACDLDDDEQISTSETNKVFPPGTKLVDAVKQIKQASRVYNAFEHIIPPLVYGREADVKDLVKALTSPAQAVVLIGGPGEGKFNVAASALLSILSAKKAPGGVWKCKMSGVTSKQQMYETVIGGLSKANRPFDTVNGIDVTWRAKLKELGRIPLDSYFLIDDCEDVVSLQPAAGEIDSVCDQFLVMLEDLRREAPKMTLLLLSRIPLPYDDLPTTKVKLKRLKDDGGKAIVQGICPQVSSADAKAIAQGCGYNPQVLSLIAHALKNGRMEIEEATSNQGLSSLAGEVGGQQLEQALRRMAASIERSLGSLRPQDKQMLIKVALMLPGAFGPDTLPEFLPEVENSSASKKVIRRLTSSGLVDPSDLSDDRYQVLHTVREAVRHMTHDGKEAEQYGIKTEDLERSWRRFVEYCLGLAKRDFKEYITQPKATYDRMITETRANIHQALQLHVFCKGAVADCWKTLVEMLSYLPYLGCIHDAPTVVAACEELASVAAKKKDATRQAMCKAVACHFMSSKRKDWINPLFDEVRDLLKGTSDPTACWCMAMALRKKGCVLRDNQEHKKEKDYGPSISTLQEAKAFAEKAAPLGTDMVKLELILCLAELAGSIDYVESRMDEGEAIANKAVSLADAMYQTDHPVSALCLSTLGYYVKARAKKAGEGTAEFKKLHEKAMELHNKALEIRLSVLGKQHLEVAMSKQQVGISMQALGDYKNAEKKYKESLQIRSEALGSDHVMVGRTYRQMASLYEAWGAKDGIPEQKNKNLIDARAKLAKILG